MTIHHRRCWIRYSLWMVYSSHLEVETNTDGWGHVHLTVHTDAKEEEAAYLLYIEDSSKNHQGGLKQRKFVPKKVKHFANTQDPARCFVRILQLYLSKLPTDAPESSFYFKPLTKFTHQSTCIAWFSKQSIGHNTLTKMMSSICISAGVQGFKTNHSLRATSATRLYQKGVDEQLIMERTGHRAIEGVRTYKHTNKDQEQVVSNLLQRNNNQVQLSSTPNNTIELNNQQKQLPPQFVQLQGCTGINITINVNNSASEVV